MARIKVMRYRKEDIVLSQMNHFEDALDTLSFLKADGFVAEKLKKIHGKSVPEAKKCAKRIASHANLASEYAKLSLEAPPEISFLPAYYCILNLSKCVSLTGKYSTEFDRHSRWHGATYDAIGKDSQSILTDQIKVRPGGALALFYKTLTNNDIKKDRVLKLRDIYCLIPGIGAELSTVTGNDFFPWLVNFDAKKIENDYILIEARLDKTIYYGNRRFYKGNVRSIPCIQGFKKKTGVNGVFVKKIENEMGKNFNELVRGAIRTEFLCYINDGLPYACFEQGASFPMPEEFATALAFFHLSSVCRYNPEFMEKLSKSKFWPMLLALRRHALFYFITSTWSYINQVNYIIKAR